MKTWLLVSGDFTPLGGMDRANHGLASYLARRGDRVILATHRAWPDLEEIPSLSVRHVPRPWGKHALGGPLLARRGARYAAEIARNGGRVVVNGGNCPWPDVNWVHYVHAAWPPLAGGGTLRRLKAAISHRSHLKNERNAVRSARLVIANSDRTRADLIERVGVDPDRVKTIYYGVDPDRFRPPSASERHAAREKLRWSPERPVVAFVGAMGDRRKGFDTVHSAWKRLVSGGNWDARLVVLGSGASLPQWKARVESEGLADSIEFLGFRGDVPEILSGCDALVAPTRYEAYGLGVHEALCCGLPALVSKTAGVAEVYPEGLESLLIPDPDDAADLAARLELWRAEMALTREKVAPLSDRLRKRTWDVMGAEIADAADETSHVPRQKLST